MYKSQVFFTKILLIFIKKLSLYKKYFKRGFSFINLCIYRSKKKIAVNRKKKAKNKSSIMIIYYLIYLYM